MWRRLAKTQDLTFVHKETLQRLVISEEGPGTILRDFEALLDYLRETRLRITDGHQLPLRSLPEINAKLARPLVLGLKRPVQKSYPHIHGLYLLVRASGLTYVGGTSNKPVLIVDPEVDRSWRGLNPSERYGTLLEAWFLRGRPEIIGERDSWLTPIPENFLYVRSFCNRIPRTGVQIAGDEAAEADLRYSPGWHGLGLLELFGLIQVKHGAPEAGKGWRIERIQLTPLGDALLTLLDKEFFSDVDMFGQTAQLGSTPAGVLRPAVQPYLPGWKRDLHIPPWVFRQGVHVFKVWLWDAWRRIAAPASSALDDLAEAILSAFDFDNDHLYRFSYLSRFGVYEIVNHSFLDDGPWTSEVLVGDVPLRVGQDMTFIFDFGDWWEFEVRLEGVESDLNITEPAILEVQGEPPPQYRWYGPDP